ncbi:MAG: hypothetical protein NTZ09_04040, partial [Candidatus Hydrogenedentes bacterium]|nr:hypothetical protein [Candidatus Hydrogenedentota bacterium]
TTGNSKLEIRNSKEKENGEKENSARASEGEVQEVWGALVKSRRAPRFHRTTWAMEFGFSSYPKFFRACLLCYGKTPHQIELEILEELLEPQMDAEEELRIKNGKLKMTERETETEVSEVKTG